MTRKLLALSLILNVLLLAGFGVLEHKVLLHDARAFWHQLMGSSTASTAMPMATGEILIVVDPSSDVHDISPFIYGVAKRDPGAVSGLGATINRWGGNPSTRYNWVIGHAWNAASDWEFRNLNYGTQGGSESDRFVTADRGEGMASIITIPAVGWVARSDKNSDQSLNVPDDGGPAISADGAIAGYDPAANRLRTSVPSLPRKNAPFVLNPDPGSAVV